MDAKTVDRVPLTSGQARIEADRCLYCFDAPCVHACPAEIDVPTFIAMIRSGNVRSAARVVRSANAFAAVCGRVCPEEVFCQSACSRAKIDAPVRIRELHYFAHRVERSTGLRSAKKFSQHPEKVVVVGCGPAGMACAFDLAKFGYVVTAIDTNLPGGVPGSSIPPFRLSAEDLQDDVEFILEHLTYERKLIDAKHLTSLRDEYDAVFLGIGLGRDRSPGIEGEHLSGVYRVLDFLRRAKQGPRVIHLGKRVVVIGGGNVSLDAAATAKALGAEHVTLIYRRSLTEMRVWRSELDEAMARGVELRLLTFPVTITGETSVKGVLCQRTRLTDQRDATGRAVAVPIPGTEHLMPADSVIIAIGQEIGSGLASLFTLSSKGYIEVDGQYKTSLPGVFAGGDAIAGEGTIVQAVAHGKGAAKAIHRFLSAGGGR